MPHDAADTVDPALDFGVGTDHALESLKHALAADPPRGGAIPLTNAHPIDIPADAARAVVAPSVRKASHRNASADKEWFELGLGAYFKPRFHSQALDLGLSLERQGDLAGAAIALATMPAAPAGHAAMLALRARVLERLGRLIEAEMCCQLSLMLDESQPDTVDRQARLQSAQGDM